MQIRRLHGIPTPLRVIRHNCLICTGGSPAAVKACGIVECRMWPYRFGRNPKEDDLQAPVYDEYGTLVGFRDYEGYPSDGGVSHRHGADKDDGDE